MEYGLKYGEIKQHVWDLMYLEEGDEEEYQKRIVSAANMALSEITRGPAPITKTIIIPAGNETGKRIMYINKLLKEAYPDKNYMFFEIPKNGLMTVKNGKYENVKYDFYSPDILIVDADEPQLILQVTIYPPRITEETVDDFYIDIERGALEITALNICYQIFKEDNERMAITYYNEYQQALETFVAKSVQDHPAINVYTNSEVKRFGL